MSTTTRNRDHPDVDVLKSYVAHGDKHFYVSTIDRASSACEGPARYNETIVWEWNYGTRERGEMLHQSGDSEGSLHGHFRICQAYHETGLPPKELDE
jgi:hypothetical protein